MWINDGLQTNAERIMWERDRCNMFVALLRCSTCECGMAAANKCNILFGLGLALWRAHVKRLCCQRVLRDNALWILTKTKIKAQLRINKDIAAIRKRCVRTSPLEGANRPARWNARIVVFFCVCVCVASCEWCVCFVLLVSIRAMMRALASMHVQELAANASARVHARSCMRSNCPVERAYVHVRVCTHT